MAIRIPNHTRSSSGPSLQGVSIGDAIKPALALSKLAGSVGRAGDALYEHDMKIMEAENAADLTEFKTAAKTAYAERQASFTNDHDHLNYGNKWDKDLDGLKKGLGDRGYSNATIEKANLYLENFTGDTRIGVASATQRKALNRSKVNFTNGVNQIEQLYDPGNPSVGYAMLNDLLGDQPQMTPEEKEAAFNQFDQTAKRKNVFAAVHEDPRGWKERNKKPGRDRALWDLSQRRANGRIRELVLGEHDVALNGILEGKINIEDVEALTPTMDTIQRTKLVNHAEDLRDKEFQKVVKSRPYQDRLAADLTSFAEGFDPVNIEGSDDELHFQRSIRQIKDKDVQKRIQGLYDNKFNEQVSQQDADFSHGLKVLTGHFKKLESKIEKPKPFSRTVRDHLKDGYIKDTEKMLSVGFSEDQIEEIREAEEDTDSSVWGSMTSFDNKVTESSQVDKFAELWKERTGEVTADAEALALADKFSKGRSSLDKEHSKKDDPAAIEDYHRQLNAATEIRGQKVTEYTRWAARNPAATYPDHLKKIKELGAAIDQDAARKRKLDPSTSSFEGKTYGADLKLSNYGYSSDSTPDSYSSAGIGHASNRLVDERSAAISKSLAVELGLKKGAVIEIQTTQGRRLVTYDDTVPSTDKRTGKLPPTIDIYRKSNGGNAWGGRVQSVKIVMQGRDGLSGARYSQFSAENYNKALNKIK